MASAHYIYDIRRHTLPAKDWEETEALVSLLVQAIECDAPLSLAGCGKDHALPASVAMFLLDGLLRLCGDEEIALVVFAAKGRMTLPQAASMLQVSWMRLNNQLKNHDIDSIRTRKTKPYYYDQAGLLDLVKASEPV